MNQSHTENRRGALIPFGERCVKGSLRSCQRRQQMHGELAARKLSAHQTFPPFPRAQRAWLRPDARALAASRVFGM